MLFVLCIRLQANGRYEVFRVGTIASFEGRYWDRGSDFVFNDLRKVTYR